MSGRLSLVILRQYRFEIGFAVLIALLAAALGFITHLRLDDLGVSQDCLDQVQASEDGGDLEAECFRLARAGTEILGTAFVNSGGILQLSIMGLLPFVVGVFGGIPVVARELEDRTAQTAWWLNGSRVRWLLQRLGSIALVLGAGIGLAALAASPVADDWVRWYGAERGQLLGTYGLPAVLRAFGAFGVGLAAGALLGRTFPAFVVSVALLLMVMVLAMGARDAWLARLPLEPLWERSAVTNQWEWTGGVPRAVAWGGPGGEVLTTAQARQLATVAGVPPAEPDDPYDTPAAEWLNENGYVEITLGTTDDAAAGWGPYDGSIFAVLGSVGVATTFAVVRRRRPFQD